MRSASFTPEQDLHFVLCDFGRSGRAYVETDPSQADASTIVRNLLDGQYTRPVQVLALNVEEGWVRDVSQLIAAKVRDVAWRDGQGLTDGTRGFIEAPSDPADHQQVLPFLQESGRLSRTRSRHRLCRVVAGRGRDDACHGRGDSEVSPCAARVCVCAVSSLETISFLRAEESAVKEEIAR